ncbi:MAG: DUF2007 domain-containing protein [Solirubrobacterales bacterium]
MSEDLVTLTVTQNQFEANALVNMLDLEGIPAMTRAADLVTTTHGGLSGRMVVLVWPRDLEAARALMTSADQRP